MIQNKSNKALYVYSNGVATQHSLHVLYHFDLKSTSKKV